MPLAAGALWVAGNHCAFRASETIGIAFAWGALLFGELDHVSGIRFVLIAIALAAVLAGFF